MTAKYATTQAVEATRSAVDHWRAGTPSTDDPDLRAGQPTDDETTDAKHADTPAETTTKSTTSTAPTV